MRYLRYLRTFRGPSCLHLILSLESCYICYSCDSCDICNERFLLARKKSLLFLRCLRYLRTFRAPSCLHLLLSLESCYICYSCDFCDICNECFLLARKNPCYFCDVCDICGHFGALLSFMFSKCWILLHLLLLRFLLYLLLSLFSWQENVLLLLRFLLFLLYFSNSRFLCDNCETNLLANSC